MSDETTQTTLFKVRLQMDTENGPASGTLPEMQQPVLEQTEKTHHTVKFCNKCGVSLSEQNKDKTHNICKSCRSVYNKKYRLKNFESLKAYDKSRSKNPSSARAAAAIRYRNNHRTELAVASRQWYKNNTVKKKETDRKRRIERPEMIKNWELKGAYGITYIEYLHLLELQNNECAVCHISLKPMGRNTHVDHDHDTGRVRGILCQNCNIMIGFARNNVELLISAIKYLQVYGSKIR